MRDILEFATRRLAEGRRVAFAVVTETWGSSPRPVGSMMAVADDGSIAGSVSGGCVEGAVIAAAQRVLSAGFGECLRFDQLDPEDVWSVGLSCGGRIEVLVSPGDGDWARAFELAEADAQFDMEITIQGGRILGVEQPADGAFVYRHSRRDQLVVVGGVHIAVPLVALAKTMGFETVLIEPRAAFAGSDRFTDPPDFILNEWPDAALEKLHLGDSTYAVLLTHDPKIDDVALRVLLRSGARYIGALGSRTTQAQRRSRLREEGFTEDDVARIHGPVGLDIGARTPEEIALSILAEIVQVRRSLPPNRMEG